MICSLVALTAINIISNVSGIVTVMCLVVPAYAFILILGFLEAFIIAQWAR
jgi:hypothetical protein